VLQNLLLLHGALGGIDQFAELKTLLDPYFRVHAFNFLGHGGREIPDQFSVQRFADETLEYLEGQKIDVAHVFGYSMGGYVALQLSKDHPDRIEKIMTLGTKFNWTKESAEKEIKMLDPEVVEAKVPKFAEMLKHRHQPEDWKTVMIKTAQMMTSLGNGAAMTEDDFRKIQNNILICLGTEDTMVTREESMNVVSNLKNGCFKLVEGFKHPIEAVDKVELSKIILDFMRDREN